MRVQRIFGAAGRVVLFAWLGFLISQFSQHPSLNLVVLAGFGLIAFLMKPTAEIIHSGPIFLSAWAFGTGWHLGGAWWMMEAAPIAGIAGATVLGTGQATWFWILIKWATPVIRDGTRRQAIGVSSCMVLLWHGIEFGRENLAFYPWNTIGTNLYAYKWARNIASVGGVQLVAVCVISVNVILFVIWTRITGFSSQLFASGIAIVLPVLIGTVIPAGGQVTATGKVLRIACVQPDGKQGARDSRGILTERTARDYQLLRLCRDAALTPTGPPDLLVLPESLYLRMLDEDSSLPPPVKLAIGKGVPFVVYGMDAELSGGVSRDFVFADATGNSQTLHSKHFLIPFAEWLPFGIPVTLMRSFSGEIGMQKVRPGPIAQGFPIPSSGVVILPMICYEDTFVAAALSAEPLNLPTVMISIGDHRFFQSPQSAEAHLRNARWRTIETGLPLIRCFTGGMTCVVMPDGSIGAQVPPVGAQLLQFDLPLSSLLNRTFYSRNWKLIQAIGYCAFPLGVIGLWFIHRRTKQSSTSTKTPSASASA